MRQKVVAEGDRLRALEVCVAGHQPVRVTFCLDRERVDDIREEQERFVRRVAAVKPEVQGDLVVARPPCVERRAGGRDLGQPALDRGVDVLVCRREFERALVELSLDSAQPALNGRQLGGGDDICGLEPARVGEAARDVVGVELEVDSERRGEALELGQQPARESAAPQLLRFGGYFVSLLASPRSRPKSRAWSRPWTRADVRRPIPHSLMKPAAADWSNSSPLP
jgi:hypothetical protein